MINYIPDTMKFVYLAAAFGACRKCYVGLCLMCRYNFENNRSPIL